MKTTAATATTATPKRATKGPPQPPKQTPEEKQAQRRAENHERIARLVHDLANIPPGLEGTRWESDRRGDLEAARAWHERNPAPANARPATVKLPPDARDGMEAMLEPTPPEIAALKRTRAMRLPVKAPPGKVSVNFLNPDGTLWERVHLDACIWAAMNRHAEAQGISLEEAATRAIQAGIAARALAKGGAK